MKFNEIILRMLVIITFFLCIWNSISIKLNYDFLIGISKVQDKIIEVLKLIMY